MPDVRTQQARELVRRVHHARQMIYDAEAAGPPNIAAIDHWEREIDAALDALADRVAALETALRPFQEFAAHAVEVRDDGTGSWLNRMGHERICDWFGPTDFAHVAALAGSGTEPPQEQPTAPCYVCGHPVAEGEGWRRNGKAWCPDHRPVWSHD